MLSVAACGGDDGGGTVEPTPTIGVSVATPTVSVTAGQSGTAAVTVTRGGGYTGPVNLTVEGTIPAGTATANPAALATGVTASTVTVTTGSATPAGTYNLTVRAAGTGAVAAVTAPLTVTVTAPVVPGFTIAPAAALTITQGAGAQTATINITRTGGFAGAVTLTTSGSIPAGLTLTPAAASTGNTMTIAVSATSAVAPGTYPITINATGAGVTGTQTTTLNVTVAAPQATPDFSIGAAAVSVAAGGTAGTSTVTITRTGGFAGAVTLTTSGAPTGLTVTAPAATTGNTADLSVTAASTLAPGTYPITVNATGAGVTGTKTATFSVTVTPAVSVGGYTLATTGAVTVQQGATATTTLNVTRTGGFAGGVTITPTGAPSGVQVTVTPNPVTGNTATVSVAAAAGATTGNATITLTGAATGIANQTTTLSVNVTAASTGGGNVGLNFCAAEAPLWVGFQNEGGAWQRATLGANNQAQVNITAARGAIAYVTATGATSFQTSVVYGTAAELTGYGTNLCSLVTGGKTHTGTVAGLSATDQATVTLGSATASPQGGTFTLTNVPPGPRDLLAVRSSFTISGSSFSIIPNKVVLRRDVNQASGTPLAAIDFGSSEAFDPASAQLTVSGLAAGEAVIPFVSLQTATGTSGTFFTGIGALTGGGTGPQTYYGLPTDRLRSTDYHLLTAIAFPSSGTNVDQTQGRITAAYFRTVSARTLTLSAALGAPTVTVVPTPYPRPRVVLARQADYADAMAATFSQTGAAPRSVAMTALASYLQGGSTWDLTFPDLSGAPGYDVNWALRSGTATTWTVAASGGTGVTLIGQVPTEGSAFRSAFRTGTVTTLLRAIRR